MANWRDSILKHFKPGIARLTLVSDPDGLLTEERMLTAIKERGFDLLPFDDSVAFRYAYETNYRSAWDRGSKTDLVVVLDEDHRLDSLPYDLLRADGRRLEFSLHKLLPSLNYPVLRSLDLSYLDALYSAAQQQQDSNLGEKATKEFVLTHCFRIVPSLISTPVELLKALLSRHYQNVPVPPPLDQHLLEMLRTKPQFADWPLQDILSNREAFLRFLQEQWPFYLEAAKSGGTDYLLPFDHQDVRAYVDTLFLEGLLKPVQVQDGHEFPPWTQIGIRHDPQADALDRFRKLVQRCQKTLPSQDSPHRDWQQFARTWAEALVLRWEPGLALESSERQGWRELHETVENRFATWMEGRYGSLASLPALQQPVMVHHVARHLAWMRAEHGLDKIALLVVDGLALDQWLVLRRCLEAKRGGWQFEESSVFAWVPTLTSVSRQAIFAAERPLLFPDSIETTDREPAHWTRFWEDQGLSRGAVEYAKMIESARSESLDVCLGNPHVAVVGLVVNIVDKIMHGEQQGTAGMHDAIRLWSDDAISLIDRLFKDGFAVFVTADHGNVAAEGMGAPREGVLVEIGGKRARIYDNGNFRAEAKAEFPESVEWPSVGLPPERYVLLPKGLRAFVSEGKQVVSHGGMALEEVIVPFVRLIREIS